MDDTTLERIIRRAGYDVRSDGADSGGADSGGAKGFYALRNGKRHTRSRPTLLALAEYLGCIEEPVKFIEDCDGLEAVIAAHALERNPFVVERAACHIAVFGRHRYVQLVSAGGHARAMYELRTDGLRRTSKRNLPTEVVAAFAAAFPRQENP